MAPPVSLRTMGILAAANLVTKETTVNKVIMLAKFYPVIVTLLMKHLHKHPNVIDLGGSNCFVKGTLFATRCLFR